MTVLIKPDDGAGQRLVRSLSSRVRQVEPGVGAPSAIPPAANTPSPEIQALEAEIDNLQRMLEAQKATALETIATVRQEERERADAAFHVKVLEHRALIAKGLESALAHLDMKCAALLPMATAIADRALSQAFGSDASQREQVTAAIKHQVLLVRRELVVAVHVSAIDFPTADNVRTLEALSPALQIRTDDRLPTGACQIDLRLGRVEISLPRYWQDVTATLQQIVDEEAAS